uniref:Uncharacterized protein n=1 Tax=Strigamia maritima TaxID=126957 RepID=T1IUT9_STRMM
MLLLAFFAVSTSLAVYLEQSSTVSVIQPSGTLISASFTKGYVPIRRAGSSVFPGLSVCYSLAVCAFSPVKVESSLIVTMPLPPLSEEAAAQLEFDKRKQVKAEAQAELHKKAANATWDVQRDQLEYYLNIVENATIITDLEAASGALSDILKDLKAAWPKRNVALASDVYVQELAWLHKSDTRVNFGERRYKAMLKHFQQSQAMNTSTSALSSLSSGIPASKVTAKLPKLEMPKFSGLVIDWQSFEDRFEAAVGKNPHLSSVDKFQYLLAACSGDAHKLIVFPWRMSHTLMLCHF